MSERLPTLPTSHGRSVAAAGRRRAGGWARALVHRRLGALGSGRLLLHDARREVEFGEAGANRTPVRVEVHRQRFYRRAPLEGSLGVAESYMG